jgi:hypothetical protein
MNQILISQIEKNLCSEIEQQQQQQWRLELQLQKKIFLLLIFFSVSCVVREKVGKDSSVGKRLARKKSVSKTRSLTFSFKIFSFHLSSLFYLSKSSDSINCLNSLSVFFCYVSQLSSWSSVSYQSCSGNSENWNCLHFKFESLHWCMFQIFLFHVTMFLRTKLTLLWKLWTELFTTFGRGCPKETTHLSRTNQKIVLWHWNYS